MLFVIALGIISLVFVLSKGVPARGRPLVVLGSGGHTGEMLAMLRGLRGPAAQPNFVYGDGDALSAERARGAGFSGQCWPLPRARRVGQGAASSVLSTLRTVWRALFIVARERPRLVLCNGPGTCVVVAVVVRLLALQTSIIYVESLARVKTLSLSGKIMYHLGLSNRFIVQWPELVREYPQAEYRGVLV